MITIIMWSPFLKIQQNIDINNTYKFVNHITSSSVPTCHVFSIFASSSVNQPTLKDISNATTAFRVKNLAGGTMIETLLGDLKTDNWMVRSKASHAGHLENLFLLIPEFIFLVL